VQNATTPRTPFVWRSIPTTTMESGSFAAFFPSDFRAFPLASTFAAPLCFFLRIFLVNDGWPSAAALSRPTTKSARGCFSIPEARRRSPSRLPQIPCGPVPHRVPGPRCSPIGPEFFCVLADHFNGKNVRAYRRCPLVRAAGASAYPLLPWCMRCFFVSTLGRSFFCRGPLFPPRRELESATSPNIPIEKDSKTKPRRRFDYRKMAEK